MSDQKDNKLTNTQPEEPSSSTAVSQEANISMTRRPQEPMQLAEQNCKTAHQLNNLLGIIRGNLEMLDVESDFSDKAQMRLVKMNTAIDAASELVTALHAASIHVTTENNGEEGQAKPTVDRDALNLQSQKTVLIVDDEADLVEIVVRQLEFRGFKTFSAISAEAAIDILRTEASIDLLFSDIVMNNGMNGLELARYVNANYPRVKVLLTTGYTQQLEKSQAAKDQFIDGLLSTRLAKPYTHQDLINAIEEVLQLPAK